MSLRVARLVDGQQNATYTVHGSAGEHIHDSAHHFTLIVPLPVIQPAPAILPSLQLQLQQE